jgi:hypothetical protein
MQAGEYLVVINAQRTLKDGCPVMGSYSNTITFKEGITRIQAMWIAQQTLDEEYFVKKYDELVDISQPSIITFLYIEPN